MHFVQANDLAIYRILEIASTRKKAGPSLLIPAVISLTPAFLTKSMNRANPRRPKTIQSGARFSRSLIFVFRASVGALDIGSYGSTNHWSYVILHFSLAI